MSKTQKLFGQAFQSHFGILSIFKHQAFQLYQIVILLTNCHISGLLVSICEFKGIKVFSIKPCFIEIASTTSSCSQVSKKNKRPFREAVLIAQCLQPKTYPRMWFQLTTLDISMPIYYFINEKQCQGCPYAKLYITSISKHN